MAGGLNGSAPGHRPATAAVPPLAGGAHVEPPKRSECVAEGVGGKRHKPDSIGAAAEDARKAAQPAVQPACELGNPRPEEPEGRAGLSADTAAGAAEEPAQRARAELIEQVAAAVQRLCVACWPSAAAVCFGSAASGLVAASSDVDMTVLLEQPAGLDHDAKRKFTQRAVRQLAGAMRGDAAFIAVEAVPTTRVPIVQAVSAAGGVCVGFGRTKIEVPNISAL